MAKKYSLLFYNEKQIFLFCNVEVIIKLFVQIILIYKSRNGRPSFPLRNAQTRYPQRMFPDVQSFIDIDTRLPILKEQQIYQEYR